MTKKLSELKESIVKNAEERAETIRSRAEKVKKRTIRAAQRKADRIVKKAEKREEDNFAREKRKVKYDLDIRARKKKLKIEQQIIDDLKQELEEKLIKIFQKDGLDDWIISQIKEIIAATQAEFTLLCKSKDVSKYEKICDKFDLEVETNDLQSGFILKSERDEYDFTFSTLAENLIENHKDEVLKILQLTEDSDG